MLKGVHTLGILCLCLFVSGCLAIPIPISMPSDSGNTQEEPMTPSEVVMTAMAGWNVDQADETQVESMLSYFADDATFQMIGFPPEIPSDFKGKEAIRAAYMSWLPLHPRLEVTIEKVEGDTVTATTSYWSDPTQAMGVAPLVGADVYVVHNGRIISEIWTLSEQSQQAFEDAFAATSEQ